MILCDIDGVLATGPAGDTDVGEPIYRTSPELPTELERIRQALIPFHVVTARVQAEAVQVLSAVGVAEYVSSIISADRLFWPTVWKAIRSGRLPGSLSKSVCGTLLPEWRDGPVVMIENHHLHLYDMLEAGIVDFGILVPPIEIAAGRVVRWFDLNLAFGLARALAAGGMSSAVPSGQQVAVFRWLGERPQPVAVGDLPATLEEGPYLLRLPSLSIEEAASPAPPLEALDTGRVLVAGRPNLVTGVRHGRRLIRRLLGRFFPRSA